MLWGGAEFLKTIYFWLYILKQRDGKSNFLLWHKDICLIRINVWICD